MTEPPAANGPSSVTSTGDRAIVGSTIGAGSIFHFGNGRNGDSLPVVVLLPLLAAVAAAVYAVLSWPGGPQHQYVWFYLALSASFVLAVLCVIGGAAAKGPKGAAPTEAPSKPSTAGLLLLSSALVLALLGLAGLEDVRRNGEITVEISVRGGQPLAGAVAGTRTLVVPASTADNVRDHLRLALTVSDDNPTSPTCVHKTTATLTPTTPGVTPTTKRVPAQAVVEFDLGGSRGEVTIDVTVRTGPGCSMQVAARGTLFND
ncbi:hypothetical protein ACWC5I_08930 [Kitasatospora sp. NPDC001574]